MPRIEAIYEVPDCACKEPKTLEAIAAEAEASAVALEGSACRPYLRIERDPKKFAACQALADKIGTIDSPKKLALILVEAMGAETRETFVVATFDTHMKLRGLWETGMGETDAVMAPRVPTLQAAIMDDAAAAAIAHCHPSAANHPSAADVEVTKQFANAFSQVGILLVDHVIVAAGAKPPFYSFAESMPKALEVR